MSAQQLSLYEMQTLGAPHNGTLTSALAAQSIKPHLGPMQRQIVAYIEEHGPSTEEEITLGSGIRLQTVCGRVNELVHQKKQLKKAGIQRRTTSGRWAEVWRLV